MLRKLKLHNYRTFLNTSIDFRRRHLLIGNNNSGKTNLASAIRFLGATSTSKSLAETCATLVPGGIPELGNWNLSSGTIEIACEVDLPFGGQECKFTYALHLKVQQGVAGGSGHPLDLVVESERLKVDSLDFKEVLLDNDGQNAWVQDEERLLDGASNSVFKTLAPRDATMLSSLYESGANRRTIVFRNFLRGWCYFSLSPLAMRNIWHQETPVVGSLNASGDNLANLIFQLKNFDEMRYRRLIEHAQQLEPNLDAINFVPVPDQGAVPSVALRGNPKASWAGLSDGTLRALAIAFIVETAAESLDANKLPPRLCVIEEPENGLFPGRLRALFELFEEYAPTGQFLFTSHSPYFINLFDASRDAVSILRAKEGRTEIHTPPPPDESEAADPDRLLLAEQYAMELIG